MGAIGDFFGAFLDERVIRGFFGELLQVFKGELGVIGTFGFIGLLMLLGLIGYSVFNLRTRTIASATLSAAFRFRFFWVMGALLLLSVIGLPMMVKGDGTSEGLAQILINYTLSFAFFFLGVGTLWFAAGSMAGDIEDAQIQMIATKPVARWQIWLGKWMGIMVLNVILLFVVYFMVLGMVAYKSNEMTANRLDELKVEVRWDDQNQSAVARDDRIFRMALMRKLNVFEVDEGGNLFLDEDAGPADRRRLQASFDAIVHQRPDVAKEIDKFMNQQRRTNAMPKLKSSETLLEEMAGIEESKMEKRVLVGRASFPLNKVEYAVSVDQTVSLRESMDSAAMKSDFDERIKGIGRTLPQLSAADQQAISNLVFQSHLLGTQFIEPNRGLRFQFTKPPGLKLKEKEPVILKIEFEDPASSYGSKNMYRFWFMYGNGKNDRIHKAETFLSAGSSHELALMPHYFDHNTNAVSFLSTNNTLNLTIINFPETPGGPALKIPFLDDFTGEIKRDNMQIQYIESEFEVNLLRACGILLAWLGLLTAMGLTAACFMSFNVSAFACIVVLFMAVWGTDQMKIVLKDETMMTTYNMEGERDSSILDWYALPMFKLAVPVLEAQRAYSPITDLSEGRSITWTELFKAYSFTWGIFGWLLGGAGAIIFTRRQLAITNSQT